MTITIIILVIIGLSLMVYTLIKAVKNAPEIKEVTEDDLKDGNFINVFRDIHNEPLEVFESADKFQPIFNHYKQTGEYDSLIYCNLYRKKYHHLHHCKRFKPYSDTVKSGSHLSCDNCIYREG